MVLDILIMEKALGKGINGRNYLQFNTFRQMRAAVSDIYSATSTDHERRYSLNSHRGSVLHMCEGDI